MADITVTDLTMSSQLLSRGLLAGGSLLIQNAAVGTFFTPLSQAAVCSVLRSNLVCGPVWSLPLLLPPSAAALHTSAVVERARQSTRLKKRKVAVENKKKKEERLRKNPPPLPKKVQLMLIAKGLGELIFCNECYRSGPVFLIDRIFFWMMYNVGTVAFLENTCYYLHYWVVFGRIPYKYYSNGI